MTKPASFESFELRSNDAWDLVCAVEAVGPDLLCRIRGGDVHIGAVALAQWKDGRAAAECLVAEGHREDKLAIHGAHMLCGASRRATVCLSGIHFEGIDRLEIDAVSQSAFALTRRAARIVEDRRLAADAAASQLLTRIRERAQELLPEVESFLAAPWESLLATHGVAAARTAAEHFGGRVGIFAPLYLSNACLNDCAYCGFRHGVKFKRTTLSLDDSIREAEHLAERGFRVLDLVTGEVPTDKFIDYVCGIISAILRGTKISGLNLNIGSLSTAQYRRLREAGATGYHLYQESYDPAVFFSVHTSGRKRDMASRLTGLQRAIEAGFEKVGLGILLGLGPPESDLARLIAHAELIQAEFPEVTLGFSLPRIQAVDEACTYEPAATISDPRFMTAVLLLRTRFPHAHLTLTTRESEEMRDALLPLGITKVSAEVATAPGGYTRAAGTETDQFRVSDERTLEEMRRAIESVRLTPSLD